jgi:hypothetical protein
MITVYRLDAQRIFIGSQEIDPYQPLPVPCVLDAPPSTTGTEVAQWAGNEWRILPERPIIPTPDPIEAKRAAATLTAAQFRLGLLAMGELDNIEAAMPQAPREVQIMWEYETSYERMHPAIVQLAAAMGYTDAQLDALFGIV